MTDHVAARHYDKQDMQVSWRAHTKFIVVCYYQLLDDALVGWWVYYNPDTGEWWEIQHDPDAVDAPLGLLDADDIPDEILKNRDQTKAIPPLYGALLKNEQDVQLLERLAFMHRREAR